MKLRFLLVCLLIATAGTAQTNADAGADQSMCISDTLKVIGKGLSVGDTGTYQWREIVSNKIVSTNANLAFKPTDTTTKLFELEVVKVINGIDYSDLDTFVLTTFPLPSFILKNIPSRCINDGCINLTQINFARAIDGKTKAYGEVHYWQKRSPSWISGNPNQVWCPDLNMSNGINFSKWDTICFEYIDGNSCYNSECKPIKLSRNPDVQVNDGVFCQQDGMVSLDKLAVKPFNKAGGVQSWRVIGVPDGSGVNPDEIIFTGGSTPITYYLDIGTPNDTHLLGNYFVEYCFKDPISGCATCDTGKITVPVLPEFEFDAIRTVCTNWPTPLDSFIHLKGSSQPFTGGQWQCIEYEGSRDKNDSVINTLLINSVIGNKSINAKKGGQYLLKMDDFTSGCLSSDSSVFTVLESPVVEIDVPDTLCSNSQFVTLKSNHMNDVNGVWSGNFITNEVFYPSVAYNMGKNPFKVKFEYTDTITLCKSSDSIAIFISKTPEINFIWSNVGAIDSIYNFTLNTPQLDSTEYSVSWDFGNGKSSIYKYPQNIAFRMNDSFSVSCIVTNKEGCADTLVKTLITKANTHIGDNESQQNIRIYPNPSNGVLNILADEDYELIITDVAGKTILETTALQTLFLPKGLYFFSVTTKKYTIVKKVIVF